MNREVPAQRKFAVVTVTLLAIGGCDSNARSSPTPSSPEAVSVVLSAYLPLGTPVTTLAVKVTASDIATPLSLDLTVTNGLATGRLRLPPGSARTIDVTAFDSTGAITHEGSKTIDVTVGENPLVSIEMVPKSGQEAGTVTIGPVSVVVQPWGSGLYTGGTLQLTATITDAHGSALPGPAAWTSSDPSVATVDATGLVTGLSSGTVRIVATYAGVVGVSQLTVIVPTCDNCWGAMCAGKCVDLLDALMSDISARLPTSFCFAQTTAPLATVCGGQSCGGSSGCTVSLAWGPLGFDLFVWGIQGSVAVSSNVDLSSLGSTCTATVAGRVYFHAPALLVCAEGSESMAIREITATLYDRSFTGCGELSGALDSLAPVFTSTVESSVRAAVAEATALASATCP